MNYFSFFIILFSSCFEEEPEPHNAETLIVNNSDYRVCYGFQFTNEKDDTFFSDYLGANKYYIKYFTIEPNNVKTVFIDSTWEKHLYENKYYQLILLIEIYR